MSAACFMSSRGKVISFGSRSSILPNPQMVAGTRPSIQARLISGRDHDTRRLILRNVPRRRLRGNPCSPCTRQEMLAGGDEEASQAADTLRGHLYCALIPAALITLPDSLISVSTNCLN